MHTVPDLTLMPLVLDAAIAVDGAFAGNVQVRDPERGELRIVAHRGFGQPFLDHFRVVTDHDGSACGHAALERRRVMIRDIETDPGFAPHRPVATEAGIRAVQSTPLVADNGALLGILSTHFARPHAPSAPSLRIIDRLCLVAARLIECARLKDAAESREWPAPGPEPRRLSHQARQAAAGVHELVPLLRGREEAAHVAAITERQLSLLIEELRRGESDRIA